MKMDHINQGDKNNNQNISDQNKHLEIRGARTIFVNEKDKTFSFASQKSEKLVAAIYLITKSFSESDQMKWTLRDLVSQIPALTIGVWSSNSLASTKSVEGLRELAQEIVSLLNSASISGMASEANVAILRREFNVFIDSIERKTKQSEITPFVGRTFFDIEEIGQNSNALNTKVKEINYKNVLDTVDLAAEKNDSSLKDKKSNSETKHQANVGRIENDTVPNEKKLKEYSPVTVKKNKRQSIIINLIKRKKEIMVKDVSQIIQDCSEKTIQRELGELVSKGLLKREGERRWSKYSFAD